MLKNSGGNEIILEFKWAKNRNTNQYLICIEDYGKTDFKKFKNIYIGLVSWPEGFQEV